VTAGRPKGSANVDWASVVARLREQPNTWMLLPEMSAVSGRTIQVIRRRERRALRLDDGEIRVMRKAALVVDDTVIVTLYTKFVPKREKTNGT
jgi:hypothetical protein